METRLETRLEVTKLRRKLIHAIGWRSNNPEFHVSHVLARCYTTTLTQLCIDLADGRISKRNIVLKSVGEIPRVDVCDERLVRIPMEIEVLKIRGDNTPAEVKFEYHISATRPKSILRR
ncbi:hypothetical protein Tco_0184155 [Tanacetum coccineum]